MPSNFSLAKSHHKALTSRVLAQNKLLEARKELTKKRRELAFSRNEDRKIVNVALGEEVVRAQDRVKQIASELKEPRLAHKKLALVQGLKENQLVTFVSYSKNKYSGRYRGAYFKGGELKIVLEDPIKESPFEINASRLVRRVN